jgi:tetratricopeptide (TPR) repeat protein
MIIDRWRIIALGSGLVALAVSEVLYESICSPSFYQHLIFFTALSLAGTFLILILPDEDLRQKTLDNKGKLWCVLVGPILLSCVFVFWWLLGQISAMGGQQIVNWLYPVAQLTFLVVLFWRNIKTTRQRTGAVSDSYDRQEYILLGERYFVLGQYQKAIDEYTIALDRDSTDGEMYYLRSMSYEELGLTELAKKDKDLSIKFGYSSIPKD